MYPIFSQFCCQSFYWFFQRLWIKLVKFFSTCHFWIKWLGTDLTTRKLWSFFSPSNRCVVWLFYRMAHESYCCNISMISNHVATLLILFSSIVFIFSSSVEMCHCSNFAGLGLCKSIYCSAELHKGQSKCIL